MQIGNQLLVFFGTQGFWLKHGNTMLLSQLFNRAGRQLVAAARRSVGLGKNAYYFVAGRQQRIKMTRCKVRRESDTGFPSSDVHQS
jgi:NADPH-dependent ferric siderophore reductase